MSKGTKNKLAELDSRIAEMKRIAKDMGCDLNWLIEDLTRERVEEANKIGKK